MTPLCTTDQISNWSVLAEGINYSITLACWASVYLSVTAYRETKLRERLVTEWQAMAQEAHLRALRSQIRPHFLFNALNAVSSLLVADRSGEAQVMLHRLKQLISAMLQPGGGHLTTMDSELHFLDHFLGIQRTRFGPLLNFEEHIGNGVRDCIVPRWFLVPVVENAVKYGLAEDGESAPVRLAVQATNSTLEITIANSLVRNEAKGFGTGLDTTDALLRAVYGDKASLTIRRQPDLFIVTITIPAVKDV